MTVASVASRRENTNGHTRMCVGKVNEKRFKCGAADCGMAFSTNQDLERRAVVHTAEKLHVRDMREEIQTQSIFYMTFRNNNIRDTAPVLVSK